MVCVAEVLLSHKNLGTITKLRFKNHETWCCSGVGEGAPLGDRSAVCSREGELCDVTSGSSSSNLEAGGLLTSSVWISVPKSRKCDIDGAWDTLVGRVSTNYGRNCLTAGF